MTNENKFNDEIFFPLSIKDFHSNDKTNDQISSISFNCRHNLVKLSVTVPVEVTDDIYIKHLISFKKWLAIVNFSEERQSIRRAFISQVKPQKSLG